MERQKNPWEEMTEEERQAMRESWKYKLPEEFDVFCTKLFDYAKPIHIPGNLYVLGADLHDVIVDGDFFCDSTNAVLGDVTVHGNFIVNSNVECWAAYVGKDFIVHGTVDSTTIHVDGLFDCYDVDSNSEDIYAIDYICQCYEEDD